MATYSTVLGLKLNDQSDPFELSDFVANWQILDSSPGIYICTSVSRPNWGAAQAGRLIFMSDLKQTSYWNGSSWQDLRDSAPVFAGGAYLNTNLSAGSSPTFNLLTFTTSRPCSLAIMMTGTYTHVDAVTQDAWQSILFDGVKQMMGGYREQIRFNGIPNDLNRTAGANATSLAMIPTVAAGQHKIGIEVDVSSNYPYVINLVGAKVMAFIALYSSGNSL